MNKAARLMPSGPALGALLPPRGAIFTSLLRNLKPDAIATNVTNYFRVVPSERGAPRRSVPLAVRAPGTGSCVGL
jgi:hypothetical protein